MDRTPALALALVALLATSGCLQAVTGGPITFSASEAGVSDAALDQHGYELEQRDSFTVDRRVDVPVVGKRRVVITNHVATYSGVTAEGGNGSASAFFVLSTPKAEVAGQGTNPLGRAPLEELVKRVAGRAGEQRSVEHVGSRTVTVLGTSTTVKKFRSETAVKGETVSTFVYVARVSHGSDYVIGVGVLPTAFADREPAVYGMLRGIEHEADG